MIIRYVCLSLLGTGPWKPVNVGGETLRYDFEQNHPLHVTGFSTQKDHLYSIKTSREESLHMSTSFIEADF